MTKRHVIVPSRAIVNGRLPYGWIPGPELTDRDNAGPNELLRDFVQGDGTGRFRLDVANGHYEVTVFVENEQGDGVRGIPVMSQRMGGGFGGGGASGGGWRTERLFP